MWVQIIGKTKRRGAELCFFEHQKSLCFFPYFGQWPLWILLDLTQKMDGFRVTHLLEIKVDWQRDTLTHQLLRVSRFISTKLRVPWYRSTDTKRIRFENMRLVTERMWTEEHRWTLDNGASAVYSDCSKGQNGPFQLHTTLVQVLWRHHLFKLIHINKRPHCSNLKCSLLYKTKRSTN